MSNKTLIEHNNGYNFVRLILNSTFYVLKKSNKTLIEHNNGHNHVQLILSSTFLCAENVLQNINRT
jgi:hypothetical protein